MASVFISYAVGGDHSFAQKLQTEFESHNQTVERIELDWGDSLKQKFERYMGFMPGVIIINPAFLEIPWPQYELDELISMCYRAMDSAKFVFIAWQDLSPESLPENLHPLFSLPNESADAVAVGDLVQKIIAQSIPEKTYGQKGHTLRGGGYDLGERMAQSFSEGELRDIAFDLGIDYGDLSGKGSSAKAYDLVANAQRTGMFEELRVLVQRRRPDMKM